MNNSNARAKTKKLQLSTQKMHILTSQFSKSKAATNSEDCDPKLRKMHDSD